MGPIEKAECLRNGELGTRGVGAKVTFGRLSRAGVGRNRLRTWITAKVLLVGDQVHCYWPTCSSDATSTL